MIEIKDIEKLAELSRINISSEETQTFRKDIESILSYVDQLKMVDAATDKAAPREEGGIKNVFREDENYHDSGQFTEALLELAPEKENGYVKVKKIL
ncbi:MAG: Asp-tRNA(Asn)/Glu-tRNA(Gln) amidotransferase subunit GatC [Patescibacteria group bacterium]